MSGWIMAPGYSFYHAKYERSPRHIGASTDYGSKLALEGFTESVAKQIAQMAGVNFLIAERNGMKPQFVGSALETTYRYLVYGRPDNPLTS